LLKITISFQEHSLHDRFTLDIRLTHSIFTSQTQLAWQYNIKNSHNRDFTTKTSRQTLLD